MKSSQWSSREVSHVVKIENVPSSITDRQISMAFRIYGPIVDIQNRSAANETAIVIFEQEPHALCAVKRTNRSVRTHI